MFSSLSATSSSSQPPRRSVASSALRNAGLARGGGDEDVAMKDAAGGVKRSARHRPHDKPTRSKRLEKMELDAASSAKANQTLASRLKGPSGNVIAIRGAAPSGGKLAARLAAGESYIPRPRVAARNVITAEARTRQSLPSVDLLRQVIQRRYNPETQFLNLERLAEDEIMKKHKIPSLESSSAPRQLGPVLFKLAGELNPPCKTVSLANNGLRTCHNLSSVNHYLPTLNALSLENNKLRDMRDLDGLSYKSVKASLSSITELVLAGNPIRDVAIQAGAESLELFKHQILKRFPMLSVLDQEVLPRLAFDVEASTVNAAAAASSSTAPSPFPSYFPVPMAPSTYVGGVDSIAGQFLTQFFAAFDLPPASRGPALAPVYAPNATFSISANTSIPPRARKRGFLHSADMPHQKELSWDYYRTESRNLERLGTGKAGPEKAFELLHSGTAEIVKALMRVPATRHDTSTPDRVVVDAFPMVGILRGQQMGGASADALFVNVHGEFAEGPSWGIRSFDRSFVLALAPEGSQARQAGWQCQILTDVFVVRSYSHFDAWAPGELLMGSPSSVSSTSLGPSGRRIPPPVAQRVPPGPGTPEPEARSSGRHAPANSLAQLQADPILASVPEYQRPLLIQLAQQTGLTIQYAGQCLEGNGWDMQRALANFAQVRDGLPQEAWLRR